jgi:hypothetical protein
MNNIEFAGEVFVMQKKPNTRYVGILMTYVDISPNTTCFTQLPDRHPPSVSIQW